MLVHCSAQYLESNSQLCPAVTPARPISPYVVPSSTTSTINTSFTFSSHSSYVKHNHNFLPAHAQPQKQQRNQVDTCNQSKDQQQQKATMKNVKAQNNSVRGKNDDYNSSTNSPSNGSFGATNANPRQPSSSSLWLDPNDLDLRFPTHSMFALLNLDAIPASDVIAVYLQDAAVASTIISHSLQVGPKTWTARLLLDTGSVLSLINDTDVPPDTQIFSCQLDMTSSNGQTTPVTQFVIGSVVDLTGNRVSFPLLLTKNLPYVVIGSLDLVHFGFSLTRTLPSHQMQKLGLLYANGAPSEQSPTDLVQDLDNLERLHEELVPLIEANAKVTELCQHHQATFNLNHL